MAKLGALWDYLTSIVGKLGDIIQSLKALPGSLIDLLFKMLKDIFIPNKENVFKMFDDTKAYVASKFPFLDYSSNIVNIFKGERFIEDVNVGLSLPYVGSVNFKIIESKYVNDAIQTFRNVIRGFLILMVMFYHLNELFTFIGQRQATVSERKPIQGFGKY